MAGVVTVALKHPIRLRLVLCTKTEASEPVLGGGIRIFQKWVPDQSKVVILNGTAVRHGEARSWPMAHGFALTQNVDADFWKTWCEQNKGAPLLTTGLLFGSPKLADVMAHAQRHRGLRTGLEPIDPTKDIVLSNGMKIIASPEGAKPDADMLADQLGEVA